MKRDDLIRAWYRELMVSGSPAMPIVIPGRWHSNDPGWERFKFPADLERWPARFPGLRVIQGGKQ